MVVHEQLAIITGTSSGLGQSLANVFLQRGWQVLGMSRRSVDRSESNYQHLSIDLSDEALPDQLRSRFMQLVTQKKWQTLVLINNAATLGDVKPLRKLGWQALNHSMRLNTCAPIWLMQLILGADLQATAKWCINISSGAATKAYPGWASYRMTKAALQMALKVAAEESKLVEEEQYFVSYAPGVLDTPMQVEVRASDVRDFPSVDRFKSLYQEGSLVDPLQPAQEILRMIEAPGDFGLSRQEPYLETRFSPRI